MYLMRSKWSIYCASVLWVPALWRASFRSPELYVLRMTWPHLMHVLCWFSFGVRLAWIRTGAQREHGWVCYGSGRKRCRLSPGEDLTLEIINENWRDP